MRQDSEVKQVFIGLGSNLDNPASQLQKAIQTLETTEKLSLVKASSLYKTAPVGPPGQPDYINAVVEIHTSMQPLELLSRLQSIENLQGRVRQQHWGARTLDLDILLYQGQQIREPDLVVPHPRIAERNFVLIPLLEITEDSLEIPGMG
ncbi:MAG: 2-amino-4-hydroxy-6-hydroxymethyldihydropteridine diphosphokinase, partial [Gammaproteobacteria bacterium]